MSSMPVTFKKSFCLQQRYIKSYSNIIAILKVILLIRLNISGE